LATAKAIALQNKSRHQMSLGRLFEFLILNSEFVISLDSGPVTAIKAVKIRKARKRTVEAHGRIIPIWQPLCTFSD
jgi:hypothetical protein